MVVKKKIEKWRVCVDFTDLNQTCLKDPFTMLKIDQLVDATVGHPRMSFLDAFQGSTYQRMMTKMFESQLGKSIEVYIDDMVVKSKVVSEHLKDLDNVFETLRRHKLRLNASKCSFGVGSGKFLGYMITHRGIEVNPDQIKAIQNLQPPRNPKEVQKLTGMAAALNQFISRSADRCKPFFSLINKWKGFEWTEECASVFQQLKDYLARLPIMSSPEPDEVLFAYIAVVPHTVSLVLIRVVQGIQRPVYCVSKSLHEAKIRYLPLEKAILAVVLGTRKLPYYFQAHTVVVLTQLPLKTVLRSADYTGRIAKWGIILRAFNIKYMPRTSVKGQILADLVAEFTEPSLEEVTTKGDMDGKSVGIISQQPLARWEVYVDGTVNRKGSGVRLVLTSPERIVIEKSLRLDFGATNNEVEYEALLMGMSMVRRMGGKAVEFDSFSLLHVSRSSNAHADSLATLATSSEQDLPRVILVEDFHEPTGAGGDAVRVHQIRDSFCWMDPIIKFLKDDTLPEERGEADKIRRKAAESLLEELHEGICGSHTEGRSLAHRALTQGYWWPNMQKEAHNYKSIVTRFGVPHTLISDNGLQFDSNAFRSYYSELRITNRYSTPSYPQGNGQAEAVNKVIVNGLKKRLDDAKGKWVEELPHVLWAYRTTPCRSTGETPFSMTYGVEAIIPLETCFPTLRTSLFSPASNDELLEASLDLIEERRESAMVRLAHYQQKLRQGYDANVKLRPLEPGNLVLRKVVGTAKNPAWGKLGLN
ncbi:uncharacterized protein LOC136069854 [Quercus suber]|uniref:uncharacterized protein LOC136069854 n=1 Tax=Quercus suber TaxID=58331 RepID=UPI0032DEAC2D